MLDILNYEFNYNEMETSLLKNKMERKQTITMDDLRRISLWKLNRTLNVKSDTLEKLEMISMSNDMTIESKFIQDTIKELVNSDGIGFPMASSILKFIRPDLFPIIFNTCCSWQTGLHFMHKVQLSTLCSILMRAYFPTIE